MRFRIARGCPPVHTAAALKTLILLLVALAGVAASACGQSLPYNRESRALLHDIMADFDAKKYDDAQSKLLDLEKKVPDDPFILNLLGAVDTKRKNFTAARGYFDRALEKQPDFFPAKFNLGELLFLERKYPEAADFFRQMLQNDPANELLQFKNFLCAYQVGDSDAAAKALKKIRFPGDTPAWYYAQAAWELKKGDKKKAREYVKTGQTIFGSKTALFDETFHDIGLDVR